MPPHAARAHRETRIHLIVGDPIGQAKSPAGLTRVFAERGVDAICIPMQVAVADLDGFMVAAKRVRNIDGIVITVPHKFAATRHCEILSERTRALAAVNVMRREPDGRWSGDMTDGVALVAALRAAGFAAKGQGALVVGAGGAGSAVVLALAEAGAHVAVHDIDAARREDLRARLAAWNIAAGTGDPTGFGLVVNATPLGMKPGDPLPVEVDQAGARRVRGGGPRDQARGHAVSRSRPASRLADPHRRGHVRPAGRYSRGFPARRGRLSGPWADSARRQSC